MREIRDPRSVEVFEQQTAPLDAGALTGHRHILLVTTRRDGQKIATPMWFAADRERRLVVRSGASDPKIARIRRNSSVTVAVCSFRGRPLGPAMRANARVLAPEEEPDAEQLLRRTLGPQRALYNMIRAPLLPMAYVEITPAESAVGD